MKELGLVQNITSTNKTYIQVNKTNNQVISDQTRFRKDEENRTLPKTSWTI